MKTLTIYYNEEKTCFQIVTPLEDFNGDYSSLAKAIAGVNGYHSIKIK